MHTEVLVLGLGPAGASAAAEAARRGRSVLAVDRKREAGRPV
jgi:flavin-dependent dehydrogenase